MALGLQPRPAQYFNKNNHLSLT